MVRVSVRDQDRIDVSPRVRIRARSVPADVQNSIAQDRIGQQAHPRDLDQDRGMPDEGDAIRHRRIFPDAGASMLDDLKPWVGTLLTPDLRAWPAIHAHDV